MKLINADDVKEMLESYRYHSFNLDDALHVIDEAPEVKAYTKHDMIMEYMKGYKRPIGHWNHSDAKEYYVICSLCKYESIIWNAKFCPGCGAYMRGDDNAEQ
jgi:hypothetical protein